MAPATPAALECDNTRLLQECVKDTSRKPAIHLLTSCGEFQAPLKDELAIVKGTLAAERELQCVPVQVSLTRPHELSAEIVALPGGPLGPREALME